MQNEGPQESHKPPVATNLILALRLELPVSSTVQVPFLLLICPRLHNDNIIWIIVCLRFLALCQLRLLGCSLLGLVLLDLGAWSLWGLEGFLLLLSLSVTILGVEGNASAYLLLVFALGDGLTDSSTDRAAALLAAAGSLS